MSKIISANFITPNAKTKNQLNRMARFDLHDRLELIGIEFGRLGFRTSFTLADQVLTHAIIANNANVEFVLDLDAKKEPRVLNSLKDITRETYNLKFQKRLTNNVEAVLTSSDVAQYLAKDKVRTLLAVNPLADWTADQLIEYALAHEVPVDPADIKEIQAVKSIKAA